jgi:hypothetical protein
MKRLEIFLLVEGIVVVLAGIFLWRIMRAKSAHSNFKDQIWDLKSPEDPEISRKLEDLVLQLEGPKKPAGAPSAGGKKPHKPQSAPFAAPKFDGLAHQVLGLSPNPSRELVKAAHRYWIMRYHPDRVAHMGKEYVLQAMRRAEQLNRARDALLRAK